MCREDANDMNLNCIHQKRCYEYLEAVAIAMGDSMNEENNISQIQAEVRIKNELCSKCKKIETETNNNEQQRNQ